MLPTIVTTNEGLLLRKLPQLLRVPPPSTVIAVPNEKVLHIKAITPILGGGVASFSPDEIDGVRIPSIRGTLRWWWRAMHPHLSLDTLRQTEQELWGGVSGDQATSSQVRLDVAKIKKSAPEPAGKHERRDGKLRPLATWTGGADYGYGLFPLQRSNDDRRQFTGSSDMPTKDWRRHLEFDLHVQIKEESLRQTFFDALTLWLVFGGYGARTRRGFGALESEDATFEEALHILHKINKVSNTRQTDRPTLAHCTVLEGPPGKPDEVHRSLLKLFSMFRQGSNVGRNPGRESNRPGRSRWPEADSLRKLTGKRFTTHPINERLLKQPNAPRAEFGLPIIVQFKDQDDKPAEATIASSADGGRFASPVFMRPVRRGNAYVPVVLILHGHRPSEVFAKMSQKTHNVPFVHNDDKFGGAADPIRHELQSGGGHAVDAFAHWLETTKGFKALLRGTR